MSSDLMHVQLHNHTNKSTLDGVESAEELVAHAASLGAPAVAITEHGNILSEHELYYAAHAYGIKPIMGLEAYMINPYVAAELAKKVVFDKGVLRNDPMYEVTKTLYEVAEYKRNHHHMLLLALNQTGVENIHKIASFTHKNVYYKPSLTHEFLEQHSDGVLAASGCMAAEIPSLINNGKVAEAEQMLDWYVRVFGDRFFMEFQSHDIPDLDVTINNGLFEMANKFNIPMIATNDIHYLKPEDKAIQDAILRIGTSKQTVSDKDKKDEGDVFSISGTGYWYRSPEEMFELFKHFGEAEAKAMLQNTVAIANDVHYERTIATGFQMPIIMPELSDEQKEEKFRQMIADGAVERYGDENGIVPQDVLDRIEYEVGIIVQMKQVDYFLILYDMIDYMKREEILYNIRGSGGGSVVLYCLYISHTNPMRHTLLFERFLNPERINMPDVDVDLVDTDRKKVIAYLLEKYGEDKVARILAFQMLRLKAAVNESCRQMGVSPDNIKRLTKFVNDHYSTVEELEADETYMGVMKTFVKWKEILDIARKIVGRVRSISMHPAGTLITREPLEYYTGLHKMTSVSTEGGEDGETDVLEVLPAQLEMGIADKIGLVKFDLLGVRTLTIIQQTMRAIEQRHGVKLTWNDIPCEFNDAYKVYHRGDTTGIFQVSGDMMSEIFQRLKPNNLDQIVGVISLYRPGSMDYIDQYIDRSLGKEEPVYPDPLFAPILEETYGIIIYQEQVINMLKAVGFSGGEADNVRRAISKKKQKEMDKAKPKFVEGCGKHNISRTKAEEIWAMIEKFANYGFNKSHSASYGEVSAKTAWLKFNYRKEYLLSCMNCEYTHTDKLMEYVGDARKSGTRVLQADINKSDVLFEIEGENIRYGLLAIKRVKMDAIFAIIRERKANGEFRDLNDLISRMQVVDGKKITTPLDAGTMTSLLLSGALDCLVNIEEAEKGNPRYELYNQLPFKYQKSLASTFAKLVLESTKIAGQKSDKDKDKEFVDNYTLPTLFPEWLRGEYSVIGSTFLTTHPILMYLNGKTPMEKFGQKIVFPDYPQQIKEGETTFVLGIVDSAFRKPQSRQLFVTIIGFNAPGIRASAFSNVYDKYEAVVHKEYLCLFEIQKNKKGYYNILKVRSIGNIFSPTTYMNQNSKA